jgi:DNA-binding response OmpR family regulator
MADRSGTVLVVEDDLSTIQLIAQVLAAAGYEPLRAREGGEALRLIREREPDLVILDLALPGLDGRSFLLSLRADKRTKRLPVIVVSANADSLSAFERRAVAAVLPKPFDVEALLAAVRGVGGPDGRADP